MLSFVIPNEEKGFTLNSVPQQQQQGSVTAQTNGGHVYQLASRQAQVRADLTSPPAVVASEAAPHGSPNNNTQPTIPLLAAVTSALDNMTSSGPMSRELSLLPAAATPHDLSLNGEEALPAGSLGCYSGSSSVLEDSYSDDAANESTLLIRPEDRSDQFMTPSVEHVFEVMTPGTDTTRCSPCGDEKPLLPPNTVITGKTGKLKRVSFGSSKGSMVETVVYDYEPGQPLREEAAESPEPRSTLHSFTTSTPLSTPARPEPSAAERAASRVRVTYFESKKPLLVPAPDASEPGLEEEEEEQQQVPVPVPTPLTAELSEMPTTYIVQTMDSGWENPFRPGGELSKEADQIVRAIQSGRPLDYSLDEADATDVLQANGDARPEIASNGVSSAPVSEPLLQPVMQTNVSAAPAPPSVADHQMQRNGAGGDPPPPPPQTAVVAQPAGTVEVHHSLVKPEDASQVEQVTLKKKPRGKCCVLQ